MKKSLLAIIAITLFLCFNAQHANAQSETPKVEVGGQAVVLHGDVGTGGGIGGRFSYNLTDHFALDTEVNVFFAEDSDSTSTEGLFGVKAGKRWQRVGLFAKARPGFITNIGSRDTRLALDLGGVVEFYPSRHTAIRIDAGDTILRLNDSFSNPFTGTTFSRTDNTHNLQASVGFTFRF